MSADFWAGYSSGAVGIIIGNPFDIAKVQLQALGRSEILASPVAPARLPSPATTSQASGVASHRSSSLASSRLFRSLCKGVAPPVLTYGPLNALLFMSYNRTLCLLDARVVDPTNPPATTSLMSIWMAGAASGLATWIFSAPTESIKCRAQMTGEGQGSWQIARQMWNSEATVHPREFRLSKGLKALYIGGAITSVRDAVGYGFYFWSYELCKRVWTAKTSPEAGTAEPPKEAVRILICGGIAGVATWMSIFPLDVIKTRIQTQDMFSSSGVALNGTTLAPEGQRLSVPHRTTAVVEEQSLDRTRMPRESAWEIAKSTYRAEGMRAFFRGMGICTVRAFIVNAVQWIVYERAMGYLKAN